MARWVLVITGVDRDLLEWAYLVITWNGGPSKAYIDGDMPKQVLDLLRERFRLVDDCGDDCLLVVDRPPVEYGSMGDGLYILVDDRLAAYLSGEALPRIVVD